MSWTGWAASAVIFLAGLAGCFQGGDDPGPEEPVERIVEGLLVSSHETLAGTLDAHAASGALSTFAFEFNATVEWPANVYRVDGRRFQPDTQADLPAGRALTLLVPPGMKILPLTVNGTVVEVPTPDTGRQLVSGEQVLEWFKVQRDEYPNRCNGCPNYARAQQYFADLFDSFGMAQVTADPYGTNAVHAEFANVVAYRYNPADLAHPRILGVGGHYDVVTGTTEGAFDDTSGTLATLEMARVFSRFDTNHNLVFGLWGGEEAGLQGSNFFAKSNPHIVSRMTAYVNLDVVGFSWPAPRPVSNDGTEPDCDALPERSATAPFFCPDPVVVSAGPDGPVATQLLDRARTIQSDVMVGYPDAYFLYEPVVDGQVQGYAAVNAQSDHTSFIAAGVPSYFLFNGNALKNPIGIHSQRDTIANWTKYVVQNINVDLEAELHPDDVAEAEALVAESLETYLWLTFYTFLRYDLEAGTAAAPLPS